MDALKTFGFCILALFAAMQISIAPEMMAEIAGKPDQILLQAVLLIPSLFAMQWMLRVFFLPAESRGLLKQINEPGKPWSYKGSSWRSLAQLGYVMVGLHLFVQFFSEADLRLPPKNYYPTAAILIALGTLGQIRLAIRAMLESNKERREERNAGEPTVAQSDEAPADGSVDVVSPPRSV